MPRKVSLGLKKKNEILTLKVVLKVHGSTEWVHSFVVIDKKDESP